jgi:hypothetical protein
MSDPPALIAKQLESPSVDRKSSLDPVAITNNDCDCDNITISTPTGSIEIVPSQKSLDSRGSQRVDFLDIVRIDEDQENEVSVMRLPTIQATISSPSKKESIMASYPTISFVGVPFGTNSNQSTSPNSESGTLTTSPRLQLPLPPAGQANFETPNSSINRILSIGGSTAASSSSKNVAKKVQKFSSMKKRKQQAPNTLLNRLFCNSPSIISSNNSMIDEEENNEPVRGSTPSINSGSNISDDTNPQTRTPARRTNPNAVGVYSLDDLSGSCVSISVNLLEQASESLTLYDEAKVRSSIQTNLQDSMDFVCASNTEASSPTTYSSSKGKALSFSQQNAVYDVKNETKSSSGVSNESVDSFPALSVKIVGDAAVGSTQRVLPVKKLNKKSSVAKDDEGNIAERVTKLSNDHDDELAETMSQPPYGSSEKLCIASLAKSQSNEEGMKTPSGKKQLKSSVTKPMKTPGGLVIPSPFTFNGKGIFPSTLVETSSSLIKSTLKKTPLKSSPRKSSKEESPIPVVYLPEIINLSVTASSSTVQSSPEKPPLSKRSSPDRIEQQRNSTAPLELVRITSSLEDLSTVPEVSSSKEVDEDKTGSNQEVLSDEIDDDAFLPNHNTSAVMANRNDIDEKVIDLVTSSTSSSDRPQLPRDKNFEKIPAVDELRAQYERKINEQKDQIALSNRVAKMRLIEIERLESLMDAMKERQGNADDLNRMKDRLRQQFQQEKKREIERACKEVESRHLFQNQSLVEENSKAKSDLRNLEEELLKVKALLLKPSEVSDEVAILKQELDEVRAKLVLKECENEKTLKELNASKEELVTLSSCPRHTENSYLKEELARALEQLSIVNEKLIQKENDLQTMQKRSFTAEPPSKATTPNSRITSSLRTTPNRSGSKVRPRPLPDGDKSAMKSRKLEELEAIHQREKEGLYQQILLLDTQAVEANLEHERALDELRRMGQLEIERVRTDLESKLEYHREIERELKENLSHANTQEKEELMEQMELLQAEKKLDRVSGLRDVQRKEELLRRIEILEQKEKDLISTHENSINELRKQNEVEIEKFRLEIKSQKDFYLERERDLELSLSKSLSFENESFVQKIESLENLLETERNESILLRSKVLHFEKDLEAVEIRHRDAVEAQKVASNSETEKLKKELEERFALEEAMQITTNERDSLNEELQKLKIIYDMETTQLTQRIDELNRIHANEKLLDQKCKDLQCKYDEQIASLVRTHSAEICSIQREMHAIEEKYKVLLTESNSQFESYQLDTENKISSLQQELSRKSFVEDPRVLHFDEEKLALQTLHAKQLKKAEENHNKIFEDLLAQLDMVEAEHITSIAVKDKALAEKEAIVDALGSQLAEAQRRTSEAVMNRNAEVLAAVELRNTCQTLERQAQTLKKEIRDLKEAQKIFLKESSIAKDKACEQAREEMIEKAEVQFQQANEHYIALRNQYDESLERAKKYENELKQLKKELERMVKEKESSEIDLKAANAQINAEKAKIEADSAQKAKEYRHELERLLQTAKDFEAKAEEAYKTSRSIQTALATVVAEKEKLQQEYDDMKSVSEELMAIVEGGERHEC